MIGLKPWNENLAFAIENKVDKWSPSCNKAQCDKCSFVQIVGIFYKKIHVSNDIC